MKIKKDIELEPLWQKLDELDLQVGDWLINKNFTTTFPSRLKIVKVNKSIRSGYTLALPSGEIYATNFNDNYRKAYSVEKAKVKLSRGDK